MTSGGSRSRSGSLKQEGSGRSDRAGFKLGVLDAAGYAGPIPNYPQPNGNPRELEVWEQLWRRPQGLLWSSPGYQWLLLTIGMYVRQVVKCEDPGIGAGQLAQLHRFADQIGMTPAGLAALGFKIEDREPAPVTSISRASSRNRLREAPEGGDAS